MFKRVLTAFLGTRHEREKKRLQPIVEAVHAHEERLASASEATLTPTGPLKVTAPRSGDTGAARQGIA